MWPKLLLSLTCIRQLALSGWLAVTAFKKSVAGGSFAPNRQHWKQFVWGERWNHWFQHCSNHRRHRGYSCVWRGTLSGHLYSTGASLSVRADYFLEIDQPSVLFLFSSVGAASLKWSFQWIFKKWHFKHQLRLCTKENTALGACWEGQYSTRWVFPIVHSHRWFN